jgi:hypothetical protein
LISQNFRVTVKEIKRKNIGGFHMYSPFSLKISPMERLFLINFEKDPDEVYIGFEPQWFNDASYGTGLRIIAWRKDGYIDVYQQPGLTKENRIDVAAKGLADTIVCPMTNARFNVTKRGVDVAFAFEDKNGRKVEVEIVEKSNKATNPFSLLAPVGSSSANPSSLPVYFMFDFYFVRQKNTEVKISIDNKNHKADTFPFPLNGYRVYFMRYSADTFLVDWCPEHSQALEPLRVEGEKIYGPKDTLYELSDHNSPAFVRISSSRKGHSFVADFHPPFPEITNIADNTSLNGEFILGSDESTGVVRGTYEVKRSGEEVEVSLNPSGGWVPCPNTLFLKFLFKVAKIFRHWPKTYLWTAKIKLSEDSQPTMESRWTRI